MSNASALEDPAVLDFCDCRMRLPQGNYFVTSLLLEQSSRKHHDKYYDIGRNPSSSTRLRTRLSDTWKKSCIRSPDAMRQPHTATEHMEWRPKNELCAIPNSYQGLLIILWNDRMSYHFKKTCYRFVPWMHTYGYISISL